MRRAVINDPSFIGWLTTGMYVAAMVLCLLAAIERRTREGAGTPSFWVLLTFALLALGINKQLDVQTMLIDLAREVAMRDGWYSNRRVAQGMSIVAGVGMFLVSVVVIRRMYKSAKRMPRCAVAGAIILAVHVLLRLADIQRIEDLIGIPAGNDLVRTAMEWLGLMLIGIGGWAAALRPATAGGRARATG